MNMLTFDLSTVHIICDTYWAIFQYAAVVSIVTMNFVWPCDLLTSRLVHELYVRDKLTIFLVVALKRRSK